MQRNRLPRGRRTGDYVTKPLPESQCKKGTLSADEIRAINVERYRLCYEQGLDFETGEPQERAARQLKLFLHPTTAQANGSSL